MADRAGWRARWCVVIPNMFAGGLSSSPSNTPSWPRLVTAWDNVGAQRELLAEVFGVTRVHAVYGWSMGAQRAYHWAAAFPDAVSRIVVNCGSARTRVHNRVFLKGMMAVLEAAPEYDGTALFSAQPAAALRAFGRLYAGWALSQDFYRAGLHLSALKAPDLDTFLRTDWEERFARRAAADLLAQMRLGRGGHRGRPAATAATSRARSRRSRRACWLMRFGDRPVALRVADEAELPHLRHGTLTPIPSIWGPSCGNPMANAEDAAFLRHHVRAFLEA